MSGVVVAGEDAVGSRPADPIDVVRSVGEHKVEFAGFRGRYAFLAPIPRIVEA